MQALGGANIVATSYDSKREVQEKDPDALRNMEALVKLGVSIRHSVDAATLGECLAGKKLSQVRHRCFARYMLHPFRWTVTKLLDVTRQYRQFCCCVLHVDRSCQSLIE